LTVLKTPAGQAQDRPVLHVVIATGIASVATQLVTIREFLSHLNGNEFVIALILFNWLFVSSLGTFLATPFRHEATAGKFYWISLCLAAMAPVQILFIRKIYDLAFILGTSPGFYPTLAYTLLTTAPYCLMLGFVLPYSLMVIKNQTPDFSGTQVYIFDNIGDIAGGVLFSFVLVYYYTPLEAIFIAHLPLIITLYRLHGMHHREKFPAVLGSLFGLAILTGAMIFELPTLTPVTGQLVHYQETPYGRIQLIQDREQFTLFQNGRPMFSSQDFIAAEEAIHYPLVHIDEVHRVLLVSPEARMMGEIRKHHPETIDCVEIDPAITDVELRFGLLEKIPEMHMIHEDARRYLARTDKTYDAIILNLPEPDTFQINRFFTDGFFALAGKRLNPGGILSFSVKGVDNYPSDTEVQKISSIYRTIRQTFAHVLLIPGARLFFICGDHPLKTDIPLLLTGKNISTAYISGYYSGNVTPERIAGIHDRIDPKAPINRDFSPYLVRILQDEWFDRFATSPMLFGLVLALINLVYAAYISREEFVLYSTGCFTMGTEILVIFAFQIFFGYVYLQIGWIITAFLAGLLPGALYGEYLRNRGKSVLMATDGAMMAGMLVFMGAIILFHDRLPAAAFLVFGFAVSVLCGCQFPVALNLQGGGSSAAVKVFSADLMGAAAGTLLTSILLVPWIGLGGAAAALILLKLTSLIILFFSHGTSFPKKISNR